MSCPASVNWEFPDSDEEDGRELFSKRRFGKVRTLPNLLNSSHAEKVWTPSALESAAGALHTPDFQPRVEATPLPAASAPSLLELGRLFIRLQSQAEEVDVHFIQAATDELNDRYQVGFSPADAVRIHAMLSSHGREEITRENFMQTLRDLLSAVVGSKTHLSFRQLRVVMATAFERFDMDDDGHISVEEFACALRSFGIHPRPAETMALFRFLSPASETEALAREDLKSPTSFTERCQVALGGAQEKAAETTGLSSAAKVLGTEEPLDTDGAEILMGTVDLATTAIAAGLVLMHTHMHPHDAGHAVCWASQWLEQIRGAMDSISSSVEDVFDSGCLLPLVTSTFLGALKSLSANDLVALDENEALLYARSFHDKDCSVSTFHRLLACGGCRWGEASAGEMLASPQELRILVRGRALHTTSQEEVKPGGVLQSSFEDQVVAAEAVTFVAWDKEKLRQFIHDAQDLQVVNLVEEMIRDASADSEVRRVRTPKDAEDSHSWLSPVLAALTEHAKRKGLASWLYLLEGLHHILDRDASAWEKMDKCRSLVLDSADSCFESASAVTDLFAAASVLMGWQQSQELSPDEMLQLAPLLVLSALVACRVASSLGGEREGSGFEVHVPGQV
ncbi:unnamed protein product [Symbiodinium natans]|uniref:EF-hand domain-containing protein n=1 Tax=Symbiodinium natans TaxID=878477 RepID=A0A812REV8_9DINO|nr:unnamed protein product [Symbiodinium natans]